MKFIALILLSLVAIESGAWWWMNPPATDQHEPVLAYEPPLEPTGLQKETEEITGTEPTSITLLPEIVASAIPSLRCTTGTSARIDYANGNSIYIAFFGWDSATSTNVLEAYKHLPEECMGSIGLTLVKHSPPRTYTVRQTESGGQGAVVEGQKEVRAFRSPALNRTITFDHTVFRDPRGVIVHAFKGTWISGANSLLGDGLRGGAEQWNQLRWKSAFKRFHPTHARVAQGAVRGIANPDRAWEAFEQAMLKDLQFAIW